MFENEIRLVPRISKPDPDVSVSWCYPGPYSIGMAGLGFQLVWWLLEQQEELSVSRCFTDQQETSSAPDLVGFTVSWELDFVNILKILDHLSVQRFSRQRGENEPLVFAGGPVVSANPEPFASIFDVILLGDAEETVPSFVQAYSNNVRPLARAGATREEMLRVLAREPGIYAPSLYECEYVRPGGPVRQVRPTHPGVEEKLTRQVYRAEDGYMAQSAILSPDTTWGATHLIEIVRSCPQECRFCLASYLTRPFRYAPVNDIVAAVESASLHTEKIGLLGPSITEHPEFDLIAERLSALPDLRVSIASVRADTLSVELVRQLVGLGQKSVTIALESGSQRLREIMRKRLDERQIVDAISAIDEGGLDGVKLYGIAGLPYETTEDLDETVRLISMLKKRHKRLKFVLGLSSFVPKAQTPFQWNGRDKRSARKMEYLRKNLARIGVDVRLESHNWSDIQALLSRGDRRLEPTLTEVAGSSGSLGAWRKAMRRRPVDCPDLDYYVFREIPRDEVLPWSHIASQDKGAYLVHQFEEARAASSISGNQVDKPID